VIPHAIRNRQADPRVFQKKSRTRVEKATGENRDPEVGKKQA
jgi:hypothetical protein